MPDPYPDAPSCFVFIRVTTPCSFCARQLLGVAAQYNVMSLRALHRSANPFLVSRPLVAALESHRGCSDCSGSSWWGLGSKTLFPLARLCLAEERLRAACHHGSLARDPRVHVAAERVARRAQPNLKKSR